MQRPSESALFSGTDIEKVKERAKAARAQFFREHPKSTIQWLSPLALVCGLAIMVTFAVGAGTARQRALEATDDMERLTSTSASAKAVTPETIRAISQLLRRSDYDCTQLACDASLERRNHVARKKLELILARLDRPTQVKSGRNSLGHGE